MDQRNGRKDSNDRNDKTERNDVLWRLALGIADTIMLEKRDVPETRWSYDTGLLLTGFEKLYEQTGKTAYLDYIVSYFNQFIKEDGTIITFDPQEQNLDNINCGRNLFYLYEQTGEKKYLQAIHNLEAQFRIQSRTKSGVYWHKKRYPNQIWLDGLFMAEPFHARYAVRFGKPELWDDIILQFTMAEKMNYEPRCGLYAHACDESRQAFWADPFTGRSLNIWGRACGWYSMALVDTLDYIPENRTRDRQAMTGFLDKLMRSVVKYQDPQGVWYQVLDNRHCDNYQEATCTCQFAYTLEKGLRMRLLETQSFETYLDRALEGILHIFTEERENGVYLKQCCAVAGLGPEQSPERDGTLEYYFHEMIRENDYKGVGPFILLASSLPHSL
ncbi:MAG: glycoside hydrolase family 88 protein [Clostridiales bacterium]|nr:glycoside hydrolase family 88 protein [Clostridiales bacterium]